MQVCLQNVVYYLHQEGYVFASFCFLFVCLFVKITQKVMNGSF